MKISETGRRLRTIAAQVAEFGGVGLVLERELKRLGDELDPR
jgi:hypothetical protein